MPEDVAAEATGSGKPSSRLRRPFASLVYREFRLLWLGQVAQAGTLWAEQVTRSWLAFELTGSLFQLGAIQGVRSASTLVLGIWGGVLADRFNKKTLLLMTQVWTFTVFTLMAAITLSGNLELWHLYVSAVALSLGNAVNQPVRTSFIPALVPERLLLNALSLNSIAINSSRLGTPIAVGAMIALTGNGGWGYALSAGLYVLMLWFTALISVRDAAKGSRDKSLAHSFAEGITFVAKDRLVLAHILVALGPLAVAFSFQQILVGYATETLSVGVTAFSALFTFAGVGALIGGGTIASRGAVGRQGYVMLGAGLMYGFILLSMGAVHFLPETWPLFWVAVPFLMVIGASQSIFRATNNSLLLKHTPAQLRGRVMGLTVPVQAMTGVAAVMAGAAADVFNPAVAMAGLGAISMAIVLGVAIAQPRLRTS